MKKRGTKFGRLLCIMFSVIATTTLIGCTNDETETIIISAYDIAVDNGFVGTEEEWLESLQGEDAEKVSVDELYEAYLVLYPDATMEEFLAQYLSITINTGAEITEAIASGLRSSVTITCGFTYTSTSTHPGQSGTTTATSKGSGVIVSLDSETGKAYIMTNYHVIYDVDSDAQHSDAIVIYPYGEESYNYYYTNSGISATYVGGSSTQDIAILEVDANDVLTNSIYKAVTFADSEDLTVGQTAIAIGNSQGQGIQATSGVVSVESEYIAMQDLEDTTATKYQRVMRIDTSINSGNSGGGLFNDDGELIGIVNAKSSIDDTEGMSYAIPVSIAGGIASLVMSGQKSGDSYIKYIVGVTTEVKGTELQEIDGNLEVVDEIEVTTIDSGSPADGIVEVGDIFVSATVSGGEKVSLLRNYTLGELMYTVGLEDTVTLVVKRNNAYIELEPMTMDKDYYTTI